jgi:leucyl aminopeptidase
MSELLPSHVKFRIAQPGGRLTRASLASLDHLIVIIPRRPAAAVWNALPEGRRLAALAKRSPDAERRMHTRIPNAASTGVTISRFADASARGTGTFGQLRHAGECMAEALADHPRTLGILVAGFRDATARDLQEALVLAAGAHAFQLPNYQTRRKRAALLSQVMVFGAAPGFDAARLQAEIEAANLVRWLTALPPNRLTATAYRAVVEELVEHHDWSARFLDVAALKNLGAGAFLAVAQGNAGKAAGGAGIMHVSYRPGGGAHPDVALVGKGIIFDTGGTNLKAFKGMLDMHQDMNGSAVALGVLLAITRLKLPIAVDCWLAITENRLSAEAYKSRDVVTAANGTTIEVIHTDAEGRMVLADTLALASREQPKLIIDYATLTGACVHALTERYSGVFARPAALNETLVEAGRRSGERVWPFPLDEDFDEDLKSTVADVVQCSPESDGDHILAARFLQRFVPSAIPLVHVDLSAAARKKGLAQVPAGPTGFGVRFTVELLTGLRAELDRAIGTALPGS